MHDKHYIHSKHVCCDKILNDPINVNTFLISVPLNYIILFPARQTHYIFGFVDLFQQLPNSHRCSI